ncbi:MAG: hypothetical protein JWO42_1642, partial [Chloroflexi bacterium]|nr:hypothetical protein [Chloroflexota bacterium]
MDTDAARDETVTFPVTHSILSHGVLLSEVSSRYDIGAPRSCTLLHHGLNDSYLLR